MEIFTCILIILIKFILLSTIKVRICTQYTYQTPIHHHIKSKRLGNSYWMTLRDEPSDAFTMFTPLCGLSRLMPLRS